MATRLLTTPRSRIYLACALGGGVAFAVFFWFLWIGSPTFFGPSMPDGYVGSSTLGAFYDEQARALMHGHWDASPNAFSFERFNVDGRFYMYFGPWPSVLRMPVMLVTSSLDGELTRASLALADATFLVFVTRLVWQVRSSTVGTRMPSRRELVGVAGFLVLVGCGTSIVFLSSSAWVYDEAMLWGAAWAVAAMSFTISYTSAPSNLALALASATACLAMMSRTSMGLIVVLALGALALVQLLTRALHEHGRAARIRLVAGVPDVTALRSAWPTVVAALAPVVLMVYVSYAKFGTLFSLPVEKQDLLLRGAQRQAVLAQSGGSFVSLRQLSTNLVHYLRPDGFNLDGLFPWITFSDPISVYAGAARDTEAVMTSFTATSTLLLALAVVGGVTIAVGRVARPLDLDRSRELRIPLLAACAGFAPTLVFPAVAERYKVDAAVALILAGALGLYATARLVRHRRASRRVVLAAIVVLMVANVWSNVGLTWTHQRVYQPLLRDAPRGAHVLDQVSWTESLGVEPRPDVVRWDRSGQGAERPPVEAVGTFAIIDDCDELLLSDGYRWLPIDPETGACAALSDLT